MTETLPEGTRTGNVITGGENAAAVTVAVVVAAGVRTALVSETETESGTAPDHDLTHRVAAGAEAESGILESQSTSTVVQNVRRL